MQVFRIAVPLGDEYAGVPRIFSLPENRNRSGPRNSVLNFILRADDGLSPKF